MSQARDCGRREFADQLNGAVRQLRQSADLNELGATLLNASAEFATAAAWFRLEDDALEGGGMRAAETGAASGFELAVPLSSANAFAGAVETRDPVIAAATASELSEPIAALVAPSGVNRVSIHPLVVGEKVPALVCAWGSVHDSALELLTQVASGVWAEISKPPAAKLVQITPPEPSAVAQPKPRPAWEELSADEQQIHLRAQRFARVQVAEMRLHEAEAVQSGRTSRDLYSELRKSIDSAREAYRQSFFACPSMVDYFHLELVRTLAHDDPELLGTDYPGPMV